MAEAAELTCSACGDLFRNPYVLPCGHSFCRRPCLLPTPSSTFAGCIYCHIGVHVSLLEQNHELGERVQSYLAKQRHEQSQRMICSLCRSLYDHCTVCSHCDQQLCDLCLKEHVDEFHTGFLVKLQSLRRNSRQLKQARDTLVSCQTTTAGKRSELLEGIKVACSELQSACKTALSRAEGRLEEVQAQSKEKLATVLDNQKRIELAVSLLQTVKDPAQYGGTQKLCELRELALGAVETLVTSEPESCLPVFENYTLTDSLQTIGLQLKKLHLLVDQESAAAVSGAEGSSEHQKFPATDTADSSKACESYQASTDSKCQEKQSGPTTSLNENASNVFIGGLKDYMKGDDLKTYFSAFGRIINVFRAVSAKSGIPLGFGFLSFVEGTDVEGLLMTKQHDIGCGFVEVRKYKQSKTGYRSNQYFDLEPLLPEQEFGTVKQTTSNLINPVGQQQQQQQKQQQQEQQQQQPKQQQHQHQQQKDLKKHQVFYKTEKPLGLYMDGLKAVITAENLKAHFARFGEVLDVDLLLDPTTNRCSGNGYIRLRPTVPRDQILDTEHIICGIRINVEEYCSSDDSESNSVSYQPLTDSQYQETQRGPTTNLNENASNVFIGGLKKHMKGDALKTYFSAFGRIINVYRAVSAKSRIPLGFGFLSFVEGTDVESLLMTKQHDIGCGFVEVRKYKPAKTGSSTNHYFDLEPLLPEQEFGTAKQTFHKTEKPLRLYMDGLKAVITVEDLKAHFARFGEVLDVNLLLDPTTNRCSGNGYIRLQPTAPRDQILDTEHIICGFRINVEEHCSSDDSESNSVSPSLDSSAFQKKTTKSTDTTTGPTIFVGGIKRKLSSDAIREYFSRFGPVTGVWRAVDTSNGALLAYGFVRFAKDTDVSAILASKRHSIDGVDVEVRPDNRPECHRTKWFDHS
nr:unnamed protein product [Spirometra erinaceieuropaei]